MPHLCLYRTKKRPVYRAASQRPIDTRTKALFSSASANQRHPVPYSQLHTACGDEGIRTPGLLRAREALSQLSYIPSSLKRDGPQWTRTIDLSLIRGML
jgi:hypothetical protein